jgi:hypothetical protein
MALTSGMWLSPWWTPHVDWVWLGGNDMGVVDQVPALSAHDSGITYRDRILYDDFEIKKYVYPFPAVMTHGFWVADVAPYAKFADDAVMTLGRGISKWEILTSPQAMTPSRYQFLGRVIGWGKRNWEILRNTEMILGDPSKGEVYGYAHTGPGAALVFLRNPSLTSRLLEVTPEQLHVLVPPAKAWQAFEVYPAPRPLDPGARLAVEVLGSQTKCIAIVWDTTLAERLRL